MGELESLVDKAGAGLMWLDCDEDRAEHWPTEGAGERVTLDRGEGEIEFSLDFVSCSTRLEEMGTWLEEETEEDVGEADDRMEEIGFGRFSKGEPVDRPWLKDSNRGREVERNWLTVAAVDTCEGDGETEILEFVAEDVWSLWSTGDGEGEGEGERSLTLSKGWAEWLEVAKPGRDGEGVREFDGDATRLWIVGEEIVSLWVALEEACLRASPAII